MNTTTPPPTPETGEGSPSFANFTIQKLERERDEARELLALYREKCAAANKGAEINAHTSHSLTAKLAEAKRELNEAREQLEAMRKAIREVFNSFADEDSAWLLDDLQTAALAKLQPFLP